MPARIIVQPVVTVDGGRMPLSSTLVDPGRPPSPSEDKDGNPILVPKNYVHVSAISDGLASETEFVRTHCLSLVAGHDLTNLDAAADVTTLFEAGTDQPLKDIHGWLTSTPAELGWTAAKGNRIRTRIENAGGDVTGLTATAALWRWVNALAQVFAPGWDVRAVMTTLAGA